MLQYEQLRKEYPLFRYKGYQLEEKEEDIQITYFFEIPGLSSFAPVWKFPKAGHKLESLKENGTFLELVFSLGMVELISYWKITCSKRVEVLAGAFSKRQMLWWKNLYFHGLGEFFYTNGIEPDKENFMELFSMGEEIKAKKQPLKEPSGCLVPIGGGKDSAVSLELLKKAGESCTCCIINPRGATLNTIFAAGYQEKDAYLLKRTLDKNMLVLNKQGFLNGHTPFSALVAFSTTIAAYLKNIRYIVLSNEASANESTVLGSTVNHQYSKSFAFEKDFHEYEAEYIGSGTYYFSLLRPLSEFQIGKYFSSCQSYHDIFRSCNAGSKEDKWCGHCSKCLFVFLILSPFISHDRLCEIFDRDMLEDKEMIPIMEQLIGMVEEKPFECVGSREEVNTAISMTIAAMEQEKKPLPRLLAHYKETPLYTEYKEKENPYFTYYEEENLLPEQFAKLIRDNCL
ncbi:MAG: hypothetical protein NC412_13400 [Roseburia sp.]|nr:hypothetical protein [Roseburia sp.]MCM1277539.1 hypothetical protein [Robinsoniella sp.]